MPRKSQASLARLKNLQKSCKATVEDVPDSDCEESDYFPGDDQKESQNCQNDGPCLEDYMDLDGEAEIRNEAVLLHFTSTLQKAQDVAVAAERIWEMKRRPKHFIDKLQNASNNSSGCSFDPKRTTTHLLRLIQKVTTMTTVLILTAHAR